MENLIRKLIEQNINGVDTYNHNGSTWLIFTDDKKWVIELTKDKTLWYNYNFFKSIFNFFSMDVVENQHYITKWVEDTVINKVKRTLDLEFRNQLNVENTIQNGVKETTPSGYLGSIEMKGKIVHQIESPKQNNEVEDTIQNGVKDVNYRIFRERNKLKDIIQNGVKETNHVDVMKFFNNKMKDTIQNGVKETKLGAPDNRDYFINEAIQNGIKETNPTKFPNGNCGYIREILRDGIKEIKQEPSQRTWKIGEVIGEGVKEVLPLPAQDGNRDWGMYYYRKGNPTKPFNEYLNEAIMFGNKEMLM